MRARVRGGVEVSAGSLKRHTTGSIPRIPRQAFGIRRRWLERFEVPEAGKSTHLSVRGFRILLCNRRSDGDGKIGVGVGEFDLDDGSASELPHVQICRKALEASLRGKVPFLWQGQLLDDRVKDWVRLNVLEGLEDSVGVVGFGWNFLRKMNHETCARFVSGRK